MELGAVGAVECRRLALTHEPSVEVTSHTVVAERISAVGGDVNVYDPVAFKVIVLCCRLTDGSVLGKDDDAGMVIADANLILCTNHSIRVDAAQA